MKIWNWKNEQCQSAMRCINNDEIPVTCNGCWFLGGSGGFVCELLDKDVWDDRHPICTVYDFTKYLLENI